MSWTTFISNLNEIMTSLWNWADIVTENLTNNKIVVVVVFSFLAWFIFEKILDLIDAIKGGRPNEDDD
ncbi:MAG: hypothetical protein PHF49_04560 [Patescibacteria group bacterium]|nr:hypothetical protein [Patescibacteria group bacterium]